MNSALINKNKPEIQLSVVGNRETSVVSLGTPVVFVMDGTNDGFDVQLPSSSNSTKAATLHAGIANTGLLANAAGGASGQVIQVYGICPQTRFSKALTRAATTDPWGSVAARAVGDGLSINTINNCLEWMSSGTALKAIHPFILAASQASNTTLASGSTFPYVGSGTSGNGAATDLTAYSTALTSVFVREM